MFSKLALMILGAFISSRVNAAPAEETVTNIPGIDQLNDAIYSGYLHVDDDKSLHYVFVESKDSPSTDPVVIWFNGGPGCSSMLAFIQEHGPYVIDDNSTTIYENPHPWNERANMLYIESPAGVGFSIAKTEKAANHNDMSQSEDTYAALLSFYDKFPEYLNNSLWVSGESYGGVYTPYLAWQIYQHNLRAVYDDDFTFINLNGTMVGNGATNWEFDVWPAFPETVFNFNMIPKEWLKTWQDNDCYYCFNDECGTNDDISSVCNDTINDIIEFTGNYNWYDLYRPNYDTDSLLLEEHERFSSVIIDGQEKVYKRGYTMGEYTPWLKPLTNEKRVFGDYVTSYMNQPELRTALNIPTTVQAWNMCGGDGTFDYHYQNEASMWIYQVLKNKYNLMFFSGDTDGAVSTWGSRQWIEALNWDVVNDYRPWKTGDQVDGYVINYDGLDFYTIHGVGHMAPQWKREPVTKMITAYIHHEEL